MSKRNDEFRDAYGEASGSAPISAGTDICRVGIKLPAFWPRDPVVWFTQVESQFSVAGITADSTKYHHVLSQIDQQYAAEVRDIVLNPPDTGKYEKLKTELIKRLTISREREVKQLLTHEDLGDRKPSQFLRHLQNLAGKEVPEDFLKTLWTSRLPSNIQTAIASQTSTSLEALADLADRIQDLVQPPVVASTSFTRDPLLETVAKQLVELSKQVNAITLNQASRSRSRSHNNNGKSRNRSRSRSKSSYTKYPTCWYHSRFGDKAHSCVKPCDYSSENKQGSR